MQITFDKNSLIIDGKRTFIISGAFHYFRTPGIEATRDRLMKLKASGCNTVDIYFNWNYHSKEKGQYDFSGDKDITKILEIAREIGLFVIARPGPFINGEVNAGGLPFWLLKEPDVIPRNRIGSEYHYSPKYMEFINEWYDQIIPRIKNFDNIIAFQIENEYATDEMDEEYMRELYKMARDKGITCPIFHNDAFNAGLWADVVDIYASDIYPYINPNQNWKKDHFCFDTVDNLEDMVRMSKENSPIFIAEMQGGWFDKWDGIGYPQMREALGREEVNIMAKTALSQGCSMMNYYMGIGGTSWDDLACDEVYTSYEFTAGIDEYGSIRPNLYKEKEINYLINSFGFTNTNERENLELGENIYAVKRKDYDNNCSWVFARNMNETATNLDIDGFEVHIEPYDMKIMPQNLKLNACTIDFSDVEIFARVKNENKEVLFMISDENSSLHINFEGEKKVISGNKKDYENIKFEKDSMVTEFVFLTRNLSDKTWIVDNQVIFNADFVYPNKRIAISKTTEIAYFDIENGFNKKYFKFTEQPDGEIELKDFDISFCAPEIDYGYNFSTWDVNENKDFDALTIKKYDEFIFYKAYIPNNLEEITLSARHLFSVYINGKEVLNRNSYKYEKLQQVPETISIPLNKNILDKEQNELTILVQNLGFDKGFSGETNFPRGLVEFSCKPEYEIKFSTRDRLAPERKDFRESHSPYLVKLSKNFKVDFKENVVKSLYLSLKDFAYHRATIFLNGVKIGRYLKNNQSVSLQEDFYLMNSFLKEENTIDIIIWERAKNIKTAWDFKNELKHVIIKVAEKDFHQLY